MKMLVTGSSGLIGSQVSEYFHRAGWEIHGIDNNQRAIFFGPDGDTRWRQRELATKLTNFRHHELDIRDRKGILACMKSVKPDVIVHTAAQPSHDRAASIPFEDFDTNAVGTLNLLESSRMFAEGATFIHMSTNKVYGDSPNMIALEELSTRWDYSDPLFASGIPETFSIDQSMHSLFGASKVAGDVLVQEYGRYFGMNTCCLRGGCLSGPSHSGVELHGFLSYLVKCNLEGRVYNIFGYKGKQVRDNIHSLDVTRFIEEFIRNPKTAAVYNIGGGKSNSCSIIEAFEIVRAFTGKTMKYEYFESNRLGDHICYYSDLRKMKTDYPGWNVSINLEQIISEIVASWKKRIELS